MNVRRVVRDVGVVAVVFVVGYILSAIWISPAPLISGSHQIVPHVLGLPQADARAQITALGFRPRITGMETHPSLPPGSVIWQDPPPGVVFPPNGVVTLTLSSGAAPVPVPDVVGLDTATARHILMAVGMRAGDIVTMTGGSEGGIVIDTRPGVGTLRSRGSKVDLVVDRGAEANPAEVNP